ncbi:MAG: hypothetical protein JXA06_00655 [Bacteroidetes bacterium]|nr:hypothetical protein [Bacteroidota bacterium]
MNRKMQDSFDETVNGKYVIIKIPRESIKKNIFSYFFVDTSLAGFRRAVWIFLCLLFLLVGMVLGAFLHNYLLHESTDKPVWKSSSLTIPSNH